MTYFKAKGRQLLPQTHHMDTREMLAPSGLIFGGNRIPNSVCLERRIFRAMKTVASLVKSDERYLPVFLRLEQELEQVRQVSKALQRARALSARKA